MLFKYLRDIFLIVTEILPILPKQLEQESVYLACPSMSHMINEREEFCEGTQADNSEDESWRKTT